MLESISVYLATVSTTEAVPQMSIIDLMFEADIVVQFVLLTLVGMSVACWVIILNKLKQLRLAEHRSNTFLDVFWKSRRLDQVYDQMDRFQGSPVASVFKAGYIELSKLTSQPSDSAEGPTQIGGEENLSRSLRRAMTTERTALERATTFLATTGSTAPFIGLFGTVWGILRAFQKMEVVNPSIQTIGPDIAHALIATAVGLAAAIPAVMAFNFFNRRIRVLSTEMDNFSADFLNIVKRHFWSR